MRKAILFGLIFLPCVLSAQQAPVIGEVQSPDATVRGSVVLGNHGASLVSGSQVTAGQSNAKIELKRGGSLQVCKESDATLTSATGGRDMLVALSTGALEVHYSLQSTSDTIVTPDFRLTLTGPGAFDLAVGIAGNGGMCVRSLPGSAASVIVNEQFGDGAHQVKPGEQVTFRNGKVDGSSPDAAGCGCPKTQTVASPATAKNDGALGFPEQQSRKAEEAVAAGLPAPSNPGVAIAPEQAAKPGQVFTQIDAPIVFRAEDLPGPAPKVVRKDLPAIPAGFMPEAEPPRPQEKRAWYQRFGRAIASIFSSDSKRKAE